MDNFAKTFISNMANGDIFHSRLSFGTIEQQFLGIFQNIKYNSSDVSQYVANGLGSAYFQAEGVHKFYTVSSGTADNNATLSEVLRFETSGNLKINDGDLTIATSGHGIDFSATSDAGGMTNELLDDYEEGTFTPVYQGAAGSITVHAYATQQGRYTKIGNMVYVEGGLQANVSNDSTGTWDIGGLPFTAVNDSASSGIIHCKEQASWTVAPHYFSIIANNSTARARGGIDVGDASYAGLSTTAFNGGSTSNNRVFFAGAYRAA